MARRKPKVTFRFGGKVFGNFAHGQLLGAKEGDGGEDGGKGYHIGTVP